MSIKLDKNLTVIASILVLFTALFDPLISFLLAILALIWLAWRTKQS